jgi:RNA polymerase sigma factor (sigma-70 family)
MAGAEPKRPKLPETEMREPERGGAPRPEAAAAGPVGPADSCPPTDPAAASPAAAAGPVGGETQRLVRDLSRNPTARAWEALSQKILRYLQTRFGRASYPPGTEFDDLVSDLIARVMGSIRSFEDRGPGSFWKWIQTIAGNIYLDMWRAHGRDQRRFVNDSTLMRPDDSNPGLMPARRDPKQLTPSVIVSARELEHAERECLASLAGHARMVYVLRRQQELSFAEISAQLGGTKETTLRSHYKRARETVRDCLCRKLDHLGEQMRAWEDNWEEAGASS